MASVEPEAGRTRSHVVVMGAGPAGLTAAYELGKHDVPVTVLEKDEHFVGGLARTAQYRGYRFDIGGHRFFSKNQEIEDLWTEILGSEMLECARLSRIYYRGRYFAYPLKVGNALWNLGPLETVRCIASYARARARPVQPPRSFEDWVTNQFGRRLFKIFFKTYTEKVWGIPTSELSADWAAQRIKGLDMGALVRSTLRWPRQSGSSPEDRSQVIRTLIDRFRYPRLGPGGSASPPCCRVGAPACCSAGRWSRSATPSAVCEACGRPAATSSRAAISSRPSPSQSSWPRSTRRRRPRSGAPPHRWATATS